ncbi:MAG: hypothetical protein WD025_06925 [Bacteriovoracaceae bacterium]
MKLVIAAALFSFISFAQDTYHAQVEKKCQEESCLVANGNEIGFYSFYAIDGREFKKLNSGANFTDVFYKGSKNCYRGNPQTVVAIMQALSGNNERDYYQGGHALVEKLTTSISDGAIEVVAQIDSDYGGYVLRFSTPACR